MKIAFLNSLVGTFARARMERKEGKDIIVIDSKSLI